MGLCNPVRVVHTVGSLRATHGGPSRSVVKLCDALARAGSDVEIVTTPAIEACVHPTEASVRVREVVAPGAMSLLPGMDSAFARTVAEAVGSGGIVHDHGMWLPTNAASAHAAARTGAPLVVSTKGMASTWALGNGHLKKRLAWVLYQRGVLAGATLVQATAADEADDIARLGLGSTVAVVRHGIDLASLGRRHERPDGAPREALFLSRVHPKKGLPLLIEAWARVQPAGWHLTIAGPDEGGHRAEVEALVWARGLADVVHFVGPVEGAVKQSLWDAADLFVLPTHSENFGLVIAEALAHGVPVLTTTGAPWAVLESEHCGWWVDVSVEALAEALARATSLLDTERQAMGDRGRAYAERELRWDRAADEMLAAYRWILGDGPRPAFVTVPSSR